jgi:hypothetical protein
MIAPARATPATICFTSFSLAYLPRARVLAQSLRAAHPHWELWALLVDVPPAGWDASGLACFDRVTRADALDIPDFAAWMFRHDVIEGCTAMKAVMLRALLGGGRDAGQHAGGAERVVYLDPDIAVFHPLCGIEQRLDTASIVLTPHQLAPDSETRAILDNELTSLRYGTYNLGFLAVRNDTSGRAFAAWWTERTRAACYDDVAAGLFTDQRYCDLVPALFTGVHIERDPGCNVASWNLGQRPVRFGARGELMAGGELLKFYHFSKIGGVGEVMTDRYAGVGTEAHELVRWYRRAVQRAGGAAAPAWHYGRFEDGRAIPRAARLLWRARPELAAEFADPFRSGPGSFQDWLDRDDPAIVLANPEDGA